MHIWLYHKERAPLSCNEGDTRTLLETLNWFDNPEFKLNDYQKKFKALVDKKIQQDKELANECRDKNSKRRSKKSV